MATFSAMTTSHKSFGFHLHWFFFRFVAYHTCNYACTHNYICYSCNIATNSKVILWVLFFLEEVNHKLKPMFMVKSLCFGSGSGVYSDRQHHKWLGHGLYHCKLHFFSLKWNRNEREKLWACIRPRARANGWLHGFSLGFPRVFHIIHVLMVGFPHPFLHYTLHMVLNDSSNDCWEKRKKSRRERRWRQKW